ncbi:unnamed protein product, partial [Mesorhabditis spiculigera]
MDGVPSAEDHARLNILVKPIGSRNPQAFNRILERLNRQQIVQVGDQQQPRVIKAHFTATVPPESTRFADFQIHRRIKVGDKVVAARRRSSVGVVVGIDDVRIFYENIKSDFTTSIVDSRCILIGYDEEQCSTRFTSRETLCYNAMEDTDTLEEEIREFLRNIYFVYEQKRMDVAFEKVEQPPCPILPEEEKLRVGTEQKTSKTYKRKCLGRCKKQQADYTLLAGLPQQALEHYVEAIEMLRQANDLLWLAGALEGWSCAAMAVLFEDDSSLSVAHGHQRYRSDEDASRLSASSSASDSADRSGTGGRRTALSWIKSDKRDRLEPQVILERFETAIENYGKFGFAAYLEYECMMKASELLRYQGKLIDMEEFHRSHVGKFLDDSFTRFDHQFKAQICSNSAEMYRKVNFHRKASFFSRLGVLFRLHVTDGETRTVADYRIVYPILYRTLGGYGITENLGREPAQNSGPFELQIKALHEVYTSALRAQLHDAAVRHLCHLLQAYYPHLDQPMRNRLVGELQGMTSSPARHNLAVHLPLEELGLGSSNIVLPPIQLVSFPQILDPEVLPLPSHLAPRVTRPSDNHRSTFIYSHFEREAEEKRRREQAIPWIVDAPCKVSVRVHNCLPQELVVRELCVLGEGVPFEAVPLKLTLPPATEDQPPNHIQHNLILVPKAAGQLTLNGYSCQVFGLKNVCKMRAPKPLTVEVLPSLPLLSILSTLPRAPVHAEVDGEQGFETTVYSGQIFSHSVTLEAIKLAPEARHPLEFTIFGVDPTATTDDDKPGNLDESRIPEASARPPSPSPSTMSELSSTGDRIPYTGRLLTAQFIFDYTADVEGSQGEVYSRTATLPLAITVVPAVTVAAWSVLPGDGPFTRYIVVDVSNSTDADAELVFSGSRAMGVPPRETCRVPLLCPCCTQVAGRAFYAAQQKDSKVMQRLEIERLRQVLESHVAEHLGIRWSIPSKELEGLVPVGALLSSVPLLKQLVLPAISLELEVNGTPYLSQDDLATAISEMTRIRVSVISSLDYQFHGELSLCCEQELSSRAEPLPRPHNMVIVGSRKQPFIVPPKTTDEQIPAPRCELTFNVLFRVEGVYKVRPVIKALLGDRLLPDEITARSCSIYATKCPEKTAFQTVGDNERLKETAFWRRRPARGPPRACQPTCRVGTSQRMVGEFEMEDRRLKQDYVTVAKFLLTHRELNEAKYARALEIAGLLNKPGLRSLMLAEVLTETPGERLEAAREFVALLQRQGRNNVTSIQNINELAAAQLPAPEHDLEPVDEVAEDQSDDSAIDA